MQKRRLLPLVALSLSVGLMSACDSTSSNSPTISSPIVAKDASGNTIDAGSTLTAGSTGHLTGTVTDVASWLWVVKNAAGTPVDTLIPSHAPAGSGDTKLGTGSDVLISFTPTAKWGPTGAYTIIGTLTGTGGGTTTTPAITFNAVPGGSSGTALNQQGTALPMGGLSASAPSFLGLSPVQTYSSSQTQANVSSIDIVMSANSTGSATVFESPALGYSNGDLVSSYWNNANVTYIVAVSTAPSTQQAAAAAIGSSTSQSATITSGGIYVVKTSNGTYAVLTVSNFTGTGDAATLNVTVLE